jgi:hypothetical protein
VQQVREHLGHVSLRAVERYLHNLPGAEAGAAGAIARVRATGVLYPRVTPSYTPVPLVSASTAAAVPVFLPKQVADAQGSAQRPLEDASFGAGAAELQPEQTAETRVESEPSLVAVTIVPAAETMIVRSEPSVDAGPTAAPEAEHVEIVPANGTRQEPAPQDEEPGLNNERIAAQKRSTPPQGRGHGRSRHRPNNKRRGGKAQNDHFRVQDRYSDDGQETNGRTPLPEPGRVPAESLATGRERYLEHLRLKAQAAVPASGDKSTSAAEPLRPTAAEPKSGRAANQTSSVSEKCSEKSDPLTSDEQRIKKPVSSTPGDQL